MFQLNPWGMPCVLVPAAPWKERTMSSHRCSKQKVLTAPLILQGNEEFEKQVNYWKLQVAELAIFLGKTRLVSAA